MTETPLRPHTNRPDDLEALLGHLRLYGRARDRATDRQLRTISITDDDAVLLLDLLDRDDAP